MTDVARIAAAMAEYDAVVADCPANKRHLGSQKCPKCGASASNDCWPSNRAADRFVAHIKDMLKEDGEAVRAHLQGEG